MDLDNLIMMKGMDQELTLVFRAAEDWSEELKMDLHF